MEELIWLRVSLRQGTELLQRGTLQRLGAIPPVAVVDDNTLLYDTNYFLLLCVTLTHRQNAVRSHKKVLKP